MYPRLWRMLPGPLWVRITTVVLLGAAVLAFLFLVAFPWLETRMVPDVPTLGVRFPASVAAVPNVATRDFTVL